MSLFSLFSVYGAVQPVIFSFGGDVTFTVPAGKTEAETRPVRAASPLFAGSGQEPAPADTRTGAGRGVAQPVAGADSF